VMVSHELDSVLLKKFLYSGCLFAYHDELFETETKIQNF
jgi:hypothetical protein